MMRIACTRSLAAGLAKGALHGVLLATLLAAPAFAQDPNSRGVRIMEDPQGPSRPALGANPPAFDQASLTAENSAGVSLEMLPGTELPVGTQISFRVTARKPGYLLLVDVDAAGKVSQIYPNSSSLLRPRGMDEVLNRVSPGKPVTIPQIGNPYAGFMFVASPPTGVAMIVAILSDKPVQLIDLPDVPEPMAGRADALKYLTEVARTLRVASANGAARLAQPNWSFSAKFYLVK
jgi:hypothetical protein